MSGPRAEFVGGAYDEAAGCWKAVVRSADGSERTLSPRHLVFANGVSGLPRIPSLPGLDEFAGEVVHSHSFTDGSPWRGKKVLVLGTGNSGHDIAQELHSHGADTTIIQRGSTTVVTVDPSAKLNYALYDEAPLEDCDLLASAGTYPLVVRGYQLAVERMVEFDKEMIAGLIARGFKYDIGEDKTGHQMKYRRRGGGYYLDVGCSGLIISGKIRLLQFDRIERFVAEGALLEGWLDSSRLISWCSPPAITPSRTTCDVCSATTLPIASDRSGASARTANWRTCGSARRKRACGSLPAASGNAVSIQNTWPCKSRRSKKACYRGDRLPKTFHGRLIDHGNPRLNRVCTENWSCVRSLPLCGSDQTKSLYSRKLTCVPPGISSLEGHFYHQECRAKRVCLYVALAAFP